ncbi:hypothetical protein EK21DRAFT_115686 [Setomelanomma holmii]|uniref:Uncharacterized protein n=1 Tax=Setomelanomma holmii TaxID=210430 RepID=A0A9P4LJF3_9PLEO|nr:hypothetical protein EK21DRAFT_115686 [Setomelanomma holmii]
MFIDKFVRTLHAETGEEHARLRILGLFRALRQTQESLSAKEAGLLETSSSHDTGLRQPKHYPRDLPRSQATLCKISYVPGLNWKYTVYKNGIKVRSEKVQKAQEKVKRIESSLSLIFGHYARIAYPTICEDALAKLPQELRDSVYAFITALNVHFLVGPVAELSKKIRPESFQNVREIDLWDNAWYLAGDCVGASMAKEIAQGLCPDSTFLLTGPALLGLLISEDRWQTGAIPRDHIRRIELIISEVLNALKCAVIKVTLELETAWRKTTSTTSVEDDFKQDLFWRLAPLLVPVSSGILQCKHQVSIKWIVGEDEYVLCGQEITEERMIEVRGINDDQEQEKKDNDRAVIDLTTMWEATIFITTGS